MSSENSDHEEPWTDRMLRSIKRCTTFTWDGERRKQYKPFMVDGVQVGIVTPAMLGAVQSEPDLFRCTEDEVHLSPSLSTYAERTDKMAAFLQKCRTGSKFVSLAGWRHENFAVNRSFYDTPLFEMERSAICLFGIKQYGCHVNGYCRHPTQGMCLWVGKRSLTKQTYPGKLDQIAAGGLPANLTIKECMMKECEEEASIPQSISSKALPAGAVSYFYEDRRGLLPETQFVFDLELPPDFEPRVKDGEVSEFFLWPVEKVKQEIATEKFKPNCALICLNFLIRHGYIIPDNEPHYLEFLSIMHHDHF